MKKTTKRLFVLALSALMLASVIGLAACGKKEDDPAVTVTLDKTSARIELEETLTLAATVSDGSAVTWSTSNAQIATVSGGVVTPVAVGNAKITATAAGGASATCSVDVYEGIDTSPLTFTLYSGEDEASSVNLIVNQTATITYTAVQSGKDADVTVNWSSSDDAVASVAGGVITAKKKGTATVTAKVTFLETDYTQTVGVTVNNDVALELEKTAVSLHPAVAESGETLAEAQLPTSVTLGAVLYANGGEDASPTLRWESDNAEVAAVNPTTGEITAAAPGSAKITAYYEGEPEQTSAYATVTVKYLKIDKSDYDFTALGANQTPGTKPDWAQFHGHDGSVFPSGWTLGYADEVELAEGVERTLDVNKKGSIAKTMVTADSPRGRVFISLRTTTFREYRLTAYFADFLIEKVAHFDEWHEKGNPAHTVGDFKKSLAILNGNVDFGGAENGVSSIENSMKSLHQFNFGGTFDGRGYTLSNVRVNGTQSGLLAGTLSGVVKNVAVKNVVLDSREGGDSGYQGGIVDYVNGGTVENCYVEGQIAENPAIRIDARGLVCSRITTGTVKNCVAVLTNAIGNTTGDAATYRAVIGNMLKVSNPAAFENCVAVGSLYAVCSQGGGGGFNWPGDVDTANSDISAGFNNVKGYKDVSAFKTAGIDTAFLSDPVWDKTNTFPVIGEVTLSVSASAIEFMAGTGSVTIAASNFADYSIVGTAAGVTLTGNVLTADPETVAHGQQVTVRAVSQIDPDVSASVTVTVNNVTEVDKTSLGSIVDFDRHAQNSPTISLEGILESGETMTSLKTAAGAVLATEAQNGKVDVPYDKWSAAITGKGEVGLVVFTDNRKAYLVTATAADWVIKTTDDLKAWHLSNNDTVGSSGTNPAPTMDYVVLAGDIDFRNEAYFQSVNQWYHQFFFGGTFDGRGYALSNVRVTGTQGGVIAAKLTAGGVIRNLKMTGVVLGGSEGSNNDTKNGYHGGIVDWVEGGVIENCYVEGSIPDDVEAIKRTVDGRGLICSRVTGGKVRNCVAVLTNADIANTSESTGMFRAVLGNMLGVPTNASAFENCIAVGSLYAICSQSGEKFDGPNGFTKPNAEMKDAFTGIYGYASIGDFDKTLDLSFLDGKYWNKTTAIPVIGEVSLGLAASAAEFNAEGGSVTILTGTPAQLSIVGEAPGVTLEGNVLTADPETVAHGQQVTVKAVSLIDPSVEGTVVVTVNNLTVEDLSGAGSIADFGILSANATQIDLSGLNLGTEETVTRVTLSTGEQIASASDIIGGKFTPSYDLWKDALTKKGETKIFVYTSARKMFIMKVNVVDRILVDLDTWKAWRASATEYTEHVILGADIDFTGVAVADFADALAANNGNPFTGTFDGRGHYLLNATLNVNQRALVVARLGVGGVVKNVGVRGMVVGEGGTNTQGLVCHQFGGTVENCYVEGEIKNTLVIGLIAANYQYGAISNCVAVATSVTVNEEYPVPYGIVAAGAFDQKTYPNPEHLAVKNCIAISDGVTSAPGFGLNGAKAVNGTAYADGADISEELANFHTYLSAAAYAKDKGNVNTTGFNSYWNFEGESPVFGA